MARQEAAGSERANRLRKAIDASPLHRHEDSRIVVTTPSENVRVYLIIINVLVIGSLSLFLLVRRAVRDRRNESHESN